MTRSGRLDMDEFVNEIDVPAIEVPDLGSSQADNTPKDLFASKERAAWKGVDVDEARCDFTPHRFRLVARNGVYFISMWKKSVYGRTLTDIKGDDNMVDYFTDNIAPLIRSVLGSHLSSDDYAVVTTPRRRHKQRNFATMISIKIAEHLGLPFYDDCALAPSKHRVGAVFTANNIPPQRNIIVIDDFVTTGQTLLSMKNLLEKHGKNAIFYAGINNKL